MKSNGKIGLMFVELCSKILIKKEVRKMKKILGLFVVCVMMSGVVYAVNPDSIVLSVTPTGLSYDIYICSATHNFGTASLGGTKDICISSVQNSGNVTSDWAVDATNAGDGTRTWDLLALVGDDDFGVMVATAADDVSAPTWTYNEVCSSLSVVGGTGAELATIGKNVVAKAWVYLWAHLSMPTTSLGSGAYSFTVSMWANAD